MLVLTSSSQPILKKINKNLAKIIKKLTLIHCGGFQSLLLRPDRAVPEPMPSGDGALPGLVPALALQEGAQAGGVLLSSGPHQEGTHQASRAISTPCWHGGYRTANQLPVASPTTCKHRRQSHGDRTMRYPRGARQSYPV